MSREEGAKGGVDELTTIVALDSFDDYVVLGAYMSKEALQSEGRVRFSP